MGKEKGGFLTPKAIANRIKSKGLQKLRWYCQMCQKQCRDENGFKCHLTSESHQRQLLLFAENPDQYIDSFSQEFMETYLELLKRRFGTKRVQANIVYQEYINDRDHTHMNSTQWETLTEFVKWMGREGHCVVDETEKGWYIAYIDRDPETIRKQEMASKKEKMALDDEERSLRFIEQQMQRAKAQEKAVRETEYTELQREGEDKVVLSGFKKPAEAAPKTKTVLAPSAFKDLKKKEKERAGSSKSEASTSKSAEKRKSALDEIMQFEEEQKEKKQRKDHWLHEGIVVKVTTKQLGDKYYKKKAVVREVVDTYGGIIKMLEGGDKLKVDQAHVETVIPALGKKVLIVNGAYRGYEATLEELDTDNFSCTIKIHRGPLKGRVVENIQYEDLSKLHTS